MSSSKVLRMVLAFVSLTCFAAGARAQATWHVDDDASSGGDGTTWATAYNSLSTALTAAQSGDQIWVAAGTYRPTSETDRMATFQLKNGVEIYGGFDGTETSLGERAGLFDQTILSGDIGTVDDNSDNSYHVVTGSGTDTTPLLDGLTITAGNADGATPSNYGGGMYNDAGSPTVYNCTFSGNTADSRGGGMYNRFSSPTVTNCTFTGNSAYGGGGMYNHFSSPTVTNCTFTGNSAYGAGGMYNWESSSPTVANCTFSSNQADYGGGMFNSNSSATVTNCAFSGNTADSRAAGMYNRYSSPTVANCTFTGNSTREGGGMYNRESSSPTVTNCTFSSNQADYGGGTFNHDSSPTVTNCIFWGDTGGEIYNEDSTPTVTYSDIHGGYAGGGNIDEDPLFVRAPDPGADRAWGTEDDDYGDLHLQDTSPCINAGDNRAVPGDIATDFEGDERIQQCRVDMGVDETEHARDCNGNGEADACDLDPTDPDGNGEVSRDCNNNGVPDECETLPSPIYVDDSAAAGLNDGSSWTDAFLELSSALVLAECTGTATEIWVATGNYKPTSGTDRTATFRLKSGVTVLGGFAGCGAVDPDERDIHLYETLLSGDIRRLNDNSDNSYHVVTGSGTDATAVLDGFVVTGGNANQDRLPHCAGGGMYNDTGSPTVTNCTFSGNSAEYSGGMFNYTRSSPTVTNCAFKGNTAYLWHGGGMYNYLNSNPIVTNCTFIGNSATSSSQESHGGGMFNSTRSSPTVTNCTFSDNSATSRGGGMYNYKRSSPTVTNCTFSGNSAEYGGGGMHNHTESDPIVTNCTFSGNSAEWYGGGMYNVSSSSPTVTNCTFTGNAAYLWHGGGMYNSGLSSPTVTKCTFEGNEANYGGGMYNSQSSSPTVTNCTFSGNQADYGGGMGSWAATPTAVNCVFTGNSVSYSGGGMYNYSSSPTVTNCTFSGNAGQWGGGIYMNLASPTIANTIIAFNSSGIHQDHVGTPTLRYNCVYGNTAYDYDGLSDPTGTDGNIAADPVFVQNPHPGPDGLWGTLDDDLGDLQLSSGSPCIDAGDNDAVPPDTPDLDGDSDTEEPLPLDLAGAPRFLDDPTSPDTGNPGATGPPVVDMGAYENAVWCGNGVVDPGEECDDGPDNSDTEPDACRSDCRLPWCGDDVVDTGEECDTGPDKSDTEPDACRTDCRQSWCGDGVVDAGEECDDGNAQSGYGCDATCHIEPEVIPTVSQWGLTVMALLLLSGLKIKFGQRRSAHA